MSVIFGTLLTMGLQIAASVINTHENRENTAKIKQMQKEMKERNQARALQRDQAKFIRSCNFQLSSSSSGVKYVSDKDISSYYDVALSADYVDVVFEAHTHQSYVLRDTKGTYHLQGGGENSGISHQGSSCLFAGLCPYKVCGADVPLCRFPHH